MNKKKSLLLAILSFVAVFALAFSFGCKNGNGEDNSGNKVNPDDDVLSGKYEDEDDEPLTPADGWVLQSILLNVEGVKTEYAYGEEFDTSKKPAVSAKYASVESLIKYEETKHLITGAAELEYKTETVTDVKVDYGQYNKDAVGTYVIYVSYTHANVTRSANYEVKVVGVTPAIGGITIELKEGFDTEYYISGPEGVNIENISEGFSVYNVDANLEVDRTEEIPAKAEETDGYTLSYFKNGEKIDNLQGLQKGVYTVYATYNSTSAFFFIEILDPVTKIELKADDETAVFTQVQSPVESMTSTWNFVVTYNSGLTKEVKKGDAGLLIGSIITVLPAENSVTVAYTEDGETKTVSVPYTVTKNEELLNEKKEFNREALGIASGDTDLTQEHLTGDNSFLKKGENSNVVLKYRPKQDNGCLEIRNDALNIEFYGFGTLMVSARSTGSSNKSAIALKNADGEYISAVYDVTDANIKEGTTKDGNVYMVSGDMQKRPAPTPEDPNKTETVPYMARILTFIVPEAGVYTLCTVDSVTVEDESAPIATGRNTRVYKIEKTDVFDASIDRTNYEFEINTDNVKKDYIAGETEISKAGLTAEFREVHTVDTDKNKTVNLTADDLTVKLTSGDLSKLNSKGTVQVSYKANGTEYKKTYEIAIKSPVTGVNAVALTKETSSYEQETENGTVTISKEDIVLHKNDKTGDVITLGEGESVEYKLFKGQEELTSWEVADGTYTIKAIVVLNNTETAVPGTTEFEASINVTVKKWVDPSADNVAYEVTYTVASDGAETPVYSWTNEWKDDKQGAATDVSVDTSKITTLSSKAEKVYEEDTSIRYSNYGEIKGPKDDGTAAKYAIVTIGEKAKNASITVYASHTSKAERSIYISTAIDTGANVVSNKVADLAMGSTASAPALMKLTADNLSAGTYYITTNANNVTIYLYAIVVSYEVAAEPGKPTKIELDASTLTVQEAIIADSTVAWGECAEIIGYGDAAGKKVAIVADNATLVGDKAGTTVSNRIKLGGGIQSKGAQGIKLTLDKACTIKAYIKNSGTGTGRIPNLFDGSKKAVTNSTTELDTVGSIHEITLNVTDEMITANSGVLYLGVNTGGCLVYYVTIDYTA